MPFALTAARLSFFLTLLPAAVSPSTVLSPANTSATVALQQTLALYPLAIDGKNFAALSAVFMQNVVANYSTPLNVLYGLEAVEAALQAALAPVSTQHALSTFSVQHLDLETGTAGTVQYYTASHFGMGEYYGEVVYAYGRYVDRWTSGDEGWRIEERVLEYMGPLIGNLSIFT
ncbi:hypothetical protein MMC17_000245 [Xylographa soralifera]|nr:hypothetical protein [Xylographa soralifera]